MSMMLLVAIFFDLVLVYFLFGQWIIRRLQPAAARNRAVLRDYERQIRHLLRVERDLLTVEQQQQHAAQADAIAEMRRSDDAQAVQNVLEKWQTRPPQALLRRSGGGVIHEYLEVLVVALGLAFAVRAFVLQPFKIPTGSMQPTLYGIHHVQLPAEMAAPNPVLAFFDLIHFGQRYSSVKIKTDGFVEALAPARPQIPFLPTTVVTIGGVQYRLPGDPGNATKLNAKLFEFFHLRRQAGSPPRFLAGEQLTHGCLVAGDHLFVNRTRFSFAEPQRGDVTVFLTDDIRDSDGGPLAGRYYIKRLVGMPGDHLKIVDRRLYYKPAGATDFTRLDAEVDPAFDRIYSFRGGYHGYSHHPGSRYLRANDDVYIVPEDHYFMLGDNSEHSKDSRFWGPVPRRNLVSRAALVWWPFSRRWGIVDAPEPVDEPSPPTWDRQLLSETPPAVAPPQLSASY